MDGKITEAEVRHVSYLARLNPTDEEVRLFSGQLSEVLAYVEQLNEVDTTDIQPTAHALPLRNVFREDRPAAGLDTGRALANAPRREGQFFAVPKVLDQDSGA